MSFIYALMRRGTNDIRYVGQTVHSPHRRLKAHQQAARRGDSGYKNNWMRSVGPDSVTVVTLEELPTSDKEILDFREQFWIAALTESGYSLVNRTEGGNGANIRGPIHTEEQKRKWSEARKGSITGDKNPNYGKKGPDHPAYGRVYSPETIARLSELKKGENNPNFGKVYSSEERAAKSRETEGIPRPKSARSAHTRYHTNKGVSKPETCKYCAEDV